MSSEQNKALAHQLIEEVFNEAAAQPARIRRIRDE